MEKPKAPTLIQSAVRMHLAKTHYQNTQKHIITIQRAIRKQLYNNKLYTDAINLLMRYGNKTEKEIPEDNYDNSEQMAEYQKTQFLIDKTEEKLQQIKDCISESKKQFQPQKEKTEKETGLPSTDVVRYGGDKIFSQLT